jgi:hypothetical protein
MARVFLVHWHESELRDLAAPLTAVGHEVQVHFATNKPPSWDGFDAQVAAISLERLPAHGREVADWVWSAKKRRHVPVVFVGGKAEKVAATKHRFPDATFCAVGDLGRVIDDIVNGRLSTAPAPKQRLKTAETAKRPSATPLARKLGIIDGLKFALVDAPRGFLKTLVAPKGATQCRDASPDCEVILLFAANANALAAGLKEHRRNVGPKASLWLAWPKRTSPLASDLSDEVVRQMGLRSGLVDVKVCAIDDDWSGLKFMVRVADRPEEQTKRKSKK